MLILSPRCFLVPAAGFVFIIYPFATESLNSPCSFPDFKCCLSSISFASTTVFPERLGTTVVSVFFSRSDFPLVSFFELSDFLEIDTESFCL